jgi:hypothetical protein
MRTAISIEDDTASMIESAPRREKFRWVKERLWANQLADMQLLVLSYRHRGKLVKLDTGLWELAAGTPYVNSPLVL